MSASATWNPRGRRWVSLNVSILDTSPCLDWPLRRTDSEWIFWSVILCGRWTNRSSGEELRN